MFFYKEKKSLIIAVILATGIFPAFSATASVVTFNGNQMNLVGSANLLNNGNLEFTNNKSTYQTSAAWLTLGVSTSHSFNFNFAFSLANKGSGYMADGITFALQNMGTQALGNQGGSLGYNGLNGVGSIIQTYSNNHVGLNTNGNAYSPAAAPTNLGLAKLVTGSETVKYNAITNVLSMIGELYVDNIKYSINDTVGINLATKFGPTMYVGLTGATGASTAEQQITSFGMSSVSSTSTTVPEPGTYATLLAGLGLMGFIRRRKTL